MASIRLIRGRIRSAKNISQITRAMEMVAASKMRKAQSQALSGRLYADKIYEMVLRLAQKLSMVSHPLLSRPAAMAGKRLAVVITTNKGLCGGLNTNLFRFLLSRPNGVTHEFVSLGRRGTDFLVRQGLKITADFSLSTPFSSAVPALTELITKEYLAGNYDGVDLIYNDFISALVQAPKQKAILPLSLEQPDSAPMKLAEILIEPDPQTVFEALLPHYLENQIRDAILQAEASEHSARMVAMRNATDNALSLISELSLLYNKARQEKITYEISDMVTARLAVEG